MGTRLGSYWALAGVRTPHDSGARLLVLAASFAVFAACGGSSERHVGASGGTAGASGTAAGGDAASPNAGDAGTAGDAGALTGGSSGTGGNAGTAGGGSGGAGGTGGTPNLPPQCLTDLAASCKLEGACVVQMDENYRPLAACYTNGVYVKYEYTESAVCMPGDQVITTVHAPGGATCYTRTTTVGAGCESSTVSWVDSEGRAIATGSTSYPGTTYSVACASGESGSCRLPCGQDPPCDPGTCDIP